MGQNASVPLEGKMQKRISNVLGTYQAFYQHVEEANQWARLCPTPKTCVLQFRIMIKSNIAAHLMSYVWKYNGNVIVEARRIRREPDTIVTQPLNAETDAREGEVAAEASNESDIIGSVKHLGVQQFYHLYCFLSDIRDCAAHSLSFPVICHGENKKEKEEASIDDDECEICMDKAKEIALTCTHSFCLSCYKTWSVQNKTCPICRTPIRCDEGEEFWHLTNNEARDLQAYANDLISRIFEFLEKIPDSEVNESGNSSRGPMEMDGTSAHTGESVDLDYVYALSLAGGIDQFEIERQIQASQQDDILAMDM